MLAQALPRVKADPQRSRRADGLPDRHLALDGTAGRRACRWAPATASATCSAPCFDVPHGYTSCVMLPAVMRWNKPANAERQALVAAAMGQPGKDAGDVLDQFIRGLGMPRSLQDVKIGPEHFDRDRRTGDGDAMGAAQPAQDRRPGAGARNSCIWPHKEIMEARCTPASTPICVRCSPPSSWRHRRGRDLPRAGSAQQPAGASVSQARPEAARPLRDLHGEQQPLPRGLRRRRAVRPVFHLRQFLPDRGRARLHPQQQPVAHPHHLARQARRRARGDQGMPRVSNSASSPMAPGKAIASSACSRPPPACRRRRSRTNPSAPRCSIPPAPPDGRRASCGRCPSSRRRSNCRCSISCKNSGSTARA